MAWLAHRATESRLQAIRRIKPRWGVLAALCAVLCGLTALGLGVALGQTPPGPSLYFAQEGVWKVDPYTGQAERVGTTTLDVVAMSWAEDTMWGLLNGVPETVVTINLETGTTGNSGHVNTLDHLTGIAYHSGYMYVVDRDEARIYKDAVIGDGYEAVTAATDAFGDVLDDAQGLAVDGDTMYVAGGHSDGSYRICVIPDIDTGHIQQCRNISGMASKPGGLTVWAGRLYAVSLYSPRVYILDPENGRATAISQTDGMGQDITLGPALAFGPTPTPGPAAEATTTPEPAARLSNQRGVPGTPTPGQLIDIDQIADSIPGGALALFVIMPLVFGAGIAVATKSAPAALLSVSGLMTLIIVFTGLSPFLFVVVAGTGVSALLIMMSMGWQQA